MTSGLPHYPCVPYSLLIHTHATSPSQSSLSPPVHLGQGQGAVVQVLTELLLLPPSP